MYMVCHKYRYCNKPLLDRMRLINEFISKDPESQKKTTSPNSELVCPSYIKHREGKLGSNSAHVHNDLLGNILKSDRERVDLIVISSYFWWGKYRREMNKIAHFRIRSIAIRLLSVPWRNIFTLSTHNRDWYNHKIKWKTIEPVICLEKN